MGRRRTIRICFAHPGGAVTVVALIVGLAASSHAQTPAGRSPAHPPAPPTALVGGMVIDGRGGAPIANGTVLIRDGRIAAVGPTGAVSVPHGVRVIRTDGMTVLPGLIDAHIHISGSGGGQVDAEERTPRAAANNLRSYLKFGVTTVFDIGANPFLDSQKKALASGRMLGPRLFGVKYGIAAPGSPPMGLLKERGLMKLLGPVYSRVETVHEARMAIERIAADRTDGVKIINTRSEFPGRPRYGADGPKLDPEVLRALVEAAHARGLKVFVHIAFPSEAREAVEAGADALTHSIGMAETGADEVFRMMAARGVAYIPTLARIEAVFAPKTDARALEALRGKVWQVILDSIADPESVVRTRLAVPGLAADAKRNFAISTANLRRAVAAGVTIVMGTAAGGAGVLHGAAVPREMELMRQAGMTPMQVIVAATRNAAEMIGQGRTLGTIEKGKMADLVIVEGNPLEDISALRRVATVVRNGYVIDPLGIPFE